MFFCGYSACSVRVARRRKKRNQVNRSTPLKILEMVMLHQIPLSPRAVLVRTRAMGIRRAVNTILVTEGGSVRPNPEKAPAVVSSTLMKS